MSSVPTLASVFKSLTSITAYKAVSGGGDQLTTLAAARDATTLTLAATTSFTALDPIIIVGDGGSELNSYASAASLVVTLGRKLALAQSVGARVYEAAAVAMGHIAEDSARFGGTSSSNPIPAATSSTPIGYLQVGGELNWGFSLLGFDTRTLAYSFGQDELETGTGVSGDPYQTVIGQGTVGTHGLLCFRAKGVRKDGMNVEVDFNDCTIDAAADVNISGKQVRPVAVGGRCTSHIMRIYA